MYFADSLAHRFPQLAKPKPKKSEGPGGLSISQKFYPKSKVPRCLVNTRGLVLFILLLLLLLLLLFVVNTTTVVNMVVVTVIIMIIVIVIVVVVIVVIIFLFNFFCCTCSGSRRMPSG